MTDSPFLPLTVSPELASFRVIRVRRAGYASEVPKGHLTIGDHARHHALLADHLDIPAVHVVGHSSGCCVSLQLALDRVQLLGLDLPVDFEAAEIVEDRLLLFREIVRFAAERGEAVGDAPGERIVLSSRRDGERDRGDEAGERDRPPEH